MSNPTALSVHDLDEDNNLHLIRRPKRRTHKQANPLAKEIATAASFAEEKKDRLVLCLLHARVQIHKDLSRHKLASSADLEEDACVVAELMAKRDKKDSIKLRDCLGFLEKVTDDPPRRSMIPRFLELVTGLLRKTAFGRPGTQGIIHQIEKVEAYARLIRGADSAQLTELTAPQAISLKLEELLAA